MRDEVLFISDLHLTIERPEVTQKFLNFLVNRAPKAEALYILGDLFDTWIGDDDFSPPIKKVKHHLKALSQQGTKVFYIHGNRDFLIGQKFSQESGATLLDEYSLINLYGTPTLLTHGDLLCTDDIAYQAFREKSHSQEWQDNVLSKPLIFRMLFARWYRLRSFFHKRKKSQTIMDVNSDTVTSVMEKYQASRLIHGHTHREAIHDFLVQHKPVQRFVLSEWTKENASVLCFNRSGYTSETI
ncbi:MAG: UDP-2,3-diacylglucosamine diphosphatase [Methyloprofundus sp.]|nr:UDP-2,3-diacylglucosamine diphosphatase [Methyloprofundus sp.]